MCDKRLEAFLVVATGRVILAREAAKHPTRHKHPTAEQHPVQYVNSTEAEQGVCWVPRNLVFIRHELASAQFHYSLSELSLIE